MPLLILAVVFFIFFLGMAFCLVLTSISRPATKTVYRTHPSVLKKLERLEKQLGGLNTKVEMHHTRVMSRTEKLGMALTRLKIGSANVATNGSG